VSVDQFLKVMCVDGHPIFMPQEPTVQVKKEEKPKQEVIKKANSPPKEELYPVTSFLGQDFDMYFNDSLVDHTHRCPPC
jgi:hypothetical protein